MAKLYPGHAQPTLAVCVTLVLAIAFLAQSDGHRAALFQGGRTHPGPRDGRIRPHPCPDDVRYVRVPRDRLRTRCPGVRSGKRMAGPARRLPGRKRRRSGSMPPGGPSPTAWSTNAPRRSAKPATRPPPTRRSPAWLAWPTALRNRSPTGIAGPYERSWGSLSTKHGAPTSYSCTHTTWRTSPNGSRSWSGSAPASCSGSRSRASTCRRPAVDS